VRGQFGAVVRAYPFDEQGPAAAPPRVRAGHNRDAGTLADEDPPRRPAVAGLRHGRGHDLQAPSTVEAERLWVRDANTNYSVVDIDLINDLYRRSYQEKVLGRERLRMMNVSRVTRVDDHGEKVTAWARSMVTGEVATLESDLVVFATGYHNADPLGCG
jgi:hypothetical protein